MERTEDLRRIVEDSRVGNTATDGSTGNTVSVIGKPALKPSEYLNLAQRVASNVESNEALVSRMDTLSARKEFSNDPTIEMAEISDLFHMKVAIVQRDFETLKRMTEDRHHQVSDGQQQMQHYKLVMQVLNKRHLLHIESFKKALKLHSEHVSQRQKRVVKYGQGSDLVRAGTVGSGSASGGGGGGEKAANNYAMFSSPIGQQNLADVHRSQELRRRPGTGVEDSQSDNGMSNQNHHHINGNMSMNMNMKASMRDENGKPYSSKNNNSSSSSSSGGGGGTSDRYGRGYGMQNQLQLQQQQQRPDRDMKARLQGAEKVEKAITQMGQLFSKMAALVLEQSETITRIEDDVEIGLSDTKEAHVSMLSFYEITKGNRSMIIKIFLLLVFFIFLFLVWT